MTRQEFDSALMTAPFSNGSLRLHDAEQRQIIDEQVEENRGLRRDVRLMQQVNAEQRAEIERQNAENLSQIDEEHEKDLAEKDRELQQIREHEFQNGYREAEAIWEEKYRQLMAQAVRFARVSEQVANNHGYTGIETREFLDSPLVRAFLKEREGT